MSQQCLSCSPIIINTQLQSSPFGFSEKTKPSVASGCPLVCVCYIWAFWHVQFQHREHTAPAVVTAAVPTQQLSNVESCKMRLHQNYEARAQNTLQLKHEHNRATLLSEILFLFSKTKTILEGQQVFELEMTKTQQSQHTPKSLVLPDMEGNNLVDCSEKSPVNINTRAAKDLHPSKFSIFPSLFLFVPSSCQESCFFPFAFIFYPQNCHHTAAAFPSPSSLPPPRFLAPFLLPRLPLETHQTGVAGDEADGEDDRRNFSEGRNERKCEEEPHKHYPPLHKCSTCWTVNKRVKCNRVSP